MRAARLNTRLGALFVGADGPWRSRSSPLRLQQIAMILTRVHTSDTRLAVAASPDGSEAQQTDDYQSPLL